MKKSNFVHLVLVATLFSSCNKNTPEKRVYMRSDTTAHYSPVYGFHRGYYVFRPYGVYDTYYGYTRAGYYSSAIHENANIGTNAFKGNVVRGGFGHSVFHVSS